MNNRQRFHAVLNYRSYDRLPVVHFGYWEELLDKWVAEGHLTKEQRTDIYEGTQSDRELAARLGFDFGYCNCCSGGAPGLLWPPFEPKRLKDNPDGSYELLNDEGVVVLQKEGVRSIPLEIRHLLTDRNSWEEHYLPRLKYDEGRFDDSSLKRYADESSGRSEPLGLDCRSLFGSIRNWLGVEGASYLYADDEELYEEIINTVGDLVYSVTKRILEAGIEFDYAHFWEDICFKNGPLVIPRVFERLVGPHYRRITELLNGYGINIVSLDCDGCIDALLPIWLANGVNTMFPIEVGTWHASIAPWREKYGRGLLGVGGMNKHVLSADRGAVDAEIERLKPLVALGGYIPCPDHRLPPDTKWELVQYYCDRMRSTF